MLVVSLCGLCSIDHTNAETNKQASPTQTNTTTTTLAATNPFKIMPFALPNEYSSLMASYRDQWSRLTGFEFSGLHWNMFVVIYVNKDSKIYKHNYFEHLRVYIESDDDEDEVEPNFKPFSVGTVFLKENFSFHEGKPDQPMTLTGMIKREQGYDPKGGDWEYFQSDAKGNIIMKGSTKNGQIKRVCSDCHSNMEDRDYIFSTYYSEPATR